MLRSILPLVTFVRTQNTNRCSDLQAVPAAERLTQETMQPAAEQAAERLDTTAQQITREVLKPGARVCTIQLCYSCHLPEQAESSAGRECLACHTRQEGYPGARTVSAPASVQSPVI